MPVLEKLQRVFKKREKNLKTYIYVSTYTGRLSDVDSTLSDIISASKRNNNLNNISGVMMFRDRQFLQVLEGDEQKIDALVRKIEQDERHYNLITIADEAIKERSFAKWDMGIFNLNKNSSLLPSDLIYYKYLFDQESKTMNPKEFIKSILKLTRNLT